MHYLKQMLWWPNEVPTIQSGSFTLRPVSEADIEAIYESCQDPLIPLFTTVPGNYTRDLAEGFVRTKTPQLFEERKAIHWIFIVKKVISPDAQLVNGETFIGPFSIHAIEENNHVGEVGYWLNKDVRGHGFAAIATRMITAYAFETFGFRRLSAIVDHDNEASKKTLLNAGYRHEGLMKGRVTRADGRQIDMDLFAATPDEWSASKFE